uniref:Uncharacterized protein n=1 Tax=Oncorhynchus mykiss TaxID=8022 RepID=A0A8C7PGQ5_ONCMY
MSKSDFPIAYEGVLHGPRHGNYPQPRPGYGLPSSAQYPGQAGYHLGYPPSRRPYSIPLGNAHLQPRFWMEYDEFAYSTAWESTSIRDAFIRKVYILAAQLIVTVSIVAVNICGSVKNVFYYDTKAVFLTDGITTIVCIIVTIFCIQTKVHVVKTLNLHTSGHVVYLINVGLYIQYRRSCVLFHSQVPRLHMLYAAIGAVVYTLVSSLKTLTFRHPRGVFFGALSLYVDIVQIFIFLLQLVGASTEQRQEDDV